MISQKQKNPTGFSDLSLTVIKLMGRGEYVVETSMPTLYYALDAYLFFCSFFHFLFSFFFIFLYFLLLPLFFCFFFSSNSFILDEVGEGHFALAEKEYTHSTAPNRRFVDMVIQRMIKAALHSEESPYTLEELEEVVAHCTDNESA